LEFAGMTESVITKSYNGPAGLHSLVSHTADTLLSLSKWFGLVNQALCLHSRPPHCMWQCPSGKHGSKKSKTNLTNWWDDAGVMAAKDIVA